MFDIVTTTSKGLDELLKQELSDICPDSESSIRPGQVSLQGTLEDAYRICLWSRLANRVLIQLAQGQVQHADDIYNIASRVNWGAQFDVETPFVIDFNGTNRVIKNSQFGALKIKDAVVDQFNELMGKRPDVDKQSPGIRFQARLRRDSLNIYLDLSGSSLHQRGYRTDTGAAPLKEHVAAAMLMRSGWTKEIDKPLVDPMCGSGTIAIEAALMAQNKAPGLSRSKWGFDNWKQHNADNWQSLVEKANESVKSCETDIVATDVDNRVLRLAKANADQAGVFNSIQFKQCDATQFSPSPNQEPGYLVCNPPYGERLGELTQLLPLFLKWGKQLKTAFRDWHVSLLTSNRDLLRQLKLIANKDYAINNGSLECQLVNYLLDEKNCVVKEGQSDNDFANRLSKNIKRLKKWLKQQDTNCYRVYDADLPEYNVAIDVYDEWAVVQEYAPPKDVPEHKSRRRLHEVLLSIPSVMNINPEKIVLKTRQQQKGRAQYEKVNDKQQMMTVYENGALFKVNLKDYLDTGLFLDHRTTRQVVKKMASGKDVLNLFAYTGSVSVHAAIGGARSVTTVDMSKTYLQWAKDNFTLNKLKGAYAFEQADCLQWLKACRRKYDLIFIDPPSFSNSKRMQDSWDVQRDHLAMLSDAVKALNPGGTIVFSNNLRNFKLDSAGLQALNLTIENISQQTLPEDFKRNPKIHNCWVLKTANHEK